MSSRKTAKGIGIGAAVVLLMILFVWKNIVARNLAAELEVARSQHSDLLYEQDQLRAEVVALSSVSRIKQIATERIGLIDPQEAPIDVPAVTSLGPADSLEAARATGLEVLPNRTENR